ncbi:PilN domain-containing protein [Scytonema sp. NUACC26]|uniref:PilN domain-containing protein n=1 Tax=Scytonema sp. NUACC26 TaxID=3140176 RepID=UPI0034DC16B8
MYSLDINFLKDRPAYNKTSEKKPRGKISLPAGDLTPLYIGVGAGLALPILIGTSWWILESKNAELGQAIVQLEQEKQSLEGQIGSINKIKEETNKIKQETQALVTVFDQIRPWSAMLQDLRDRIPKTVQIETIKQIAPSAPVAGQPAPNPAGGIEIVGVARSFNQVNDFMLTLQQSRFLKGTETRITTAELIDAPVPAGVTLPQGFKPPQIVRYTIQSSMSDVPASELMRELEQKGTVGLVSRIRNLQKTGVLQK